MTSVWRGAPCVERYSRELVSKPAILLKKSWGGYRRTTQELRHVDSCQPESASYRYCSTRP